MPMEPLTAEEIADFRAYLARCKVPVQAGDALPPDWRDLMDASWEIRFFNALPRLLDEVEQVRAGAVVIRLEDDGKSVPFGDAVVEVVGKYQALLKRAREQLFVGLGGIPLGRNTDELIREIDAILG